MKNRITKYHLATLPIIFLASILLLFTSISIDTLLPFFITYTFAAFFEHPNINSYKENPRKRLAFVSVLFSIWNFLNLNIKEGIRYRELILTHATGLCYGLVFVLVDFSVGSLIALFFGAILFEVSFRLYSRLTFEDET
ncbi:MAG: hypothetical protein BM556_17160 [Bacteriovorax sp. MedPE-SWde]|nr:MAG: hypothetical protein BM556_17160 [Bacteriovorax sp. MedPE-SWde]